MTLLGWVLRELGLQPCKALIATQRASSTPQQCIFVPSYIEIMMYLDHVSESDTHFSPHLESDPGPTGGCVSLAETWEGMHCILSLIDGASN